MADYLSRSIGEVADEDVTVDLNVGRFLAERTTRKMIGLVLDSAEKQVGHFEQYEEYLEEVKSYLESLDGVHVLVRVGRGL